MVVMLRSKYVCEDKLLAQNTRDDSRRADDVGMVLTLCRGRHGEIAESDRVPRIVAYRRFVKSTSRLCGKAHANCFEQTTCFLEMLVEDISNLVF